MLRNPDKINWCCFSTNPAMFEFDKSRYEKMINKI
jgi:hypothetical protein